MTSHKTDDELIPLNTDLKLNYNGSDNDQDDITFSSKPAAGTFKRKLDDYFHITERGSNINQVCIF